MGFPSTLLGCQYERTPDGHIAMHQEAYINELLRRCAFTNCNPVSTPAVKHPEKAGGAEPSSLIKSGYSIQSINGALGWLARNSRPDINYAWSILAQHIADKDQTVQWRRAGRILRYLKGTPRLGILWRKAVHDDLIGFTDANWGGVEHKKSQSGWIFMLAGAPLMWASIRQRSVSMSTTEAEIIALATGLKNALGLRNIFTEIKEEVPTPLIIHVDNQAAIVLAETKGLRHVDLSYSFVNDEVANGTVAVKFVPSKDQLADIFTKALGRVEHERAVKLLMTDLAP